jgi:O-methyltransferase
MRKMASLLGYDIIRKHPIEIRAREIYLRYGDHTMIPQSLYVDNLKLIWDFRNVKGCVVECGVWKGGMIAGIAEILGDRSFYLCDSFEGLPAAKEIDGSRALEWQRDKTGAYYYDNCKTEIVFADEMMRQTGVNYRIIKGWFSDTLPDMEIDQPIAVLRLDSDWYESTWDCLSNLYAKVAPGGIIIFDDYHVFDGCSRAVHDFLSKNSLPVRLSAGYSGVAYLIKKE